MSISTIGLASLLCTTAQAPVALQYYQGGFLVQSGIFTFPVPIEQPTPPPAVIRYRRGDKYAVWDARGLTTRDGEWSLTTRLEEAAVSPRLFERKEILANLERFKTGDRVKQASTLAGTVRVGPDAYFLVRWVDKAGQPWLETLVRVDLSKDRPKPQLLGRLEGTTLAGGALDDRLFAVGDRAAAIVRRGTDWGLATFDPVAGSFRFDKLGERLRAHASLDPERVVYVELLPYGPTRVGILTLATGSREELFEARGNARLVDVEDPLCWVTSTPAGQTLRNAATGAAVNLPKEAAVQRSHVGFVAWWPREEPTKAVLLDPHRWTTLAEWAATPPASAIAAPTPAASPPAREAQRQTDPPRGQ